MWSSLSKITTVVYGTIQGTIQGALIWVYTLGIMSKLVAAAKAGDQDCLQRLLNSVPEDTQLTDDGSGSPIHWAAAVGDRGCIALLMKRFDIFARDAAGFTVLHYAAQNGHADCVAFILDAASSLINQVEPAWSRTALHLAAQQGHVAVCRTLVRRGASIGHLTFNGDSRGYTPLEFARKFVDEPYKEDLKEQRQAVVAYLSSDAPLDAEAAQRRFFAMDVEQANIVAPQATSVEPTEMDDTRSERSSSSARRESGATRSCVGAATPNEATLPGTVTVESSAPASSEAAASAAGPPAVARGASNCSDDSLHSRDATETADTAAVARAASNCSAESINSRDATETAVVLISQPKGPADCLPRPNSVFANSLSSSPRPCHSACGAPPSPSGSARFLVPATSAVDDSLGERVGLGARKPLPVGAASPRSDTASLGVSTSTDDR